MEDQTREKTDELIDALEELGVEVTAFNLNEWHRGDPTTTDDTATGAEIDITCFLDYENDGGDENDFRVK